MKLTLILMEFMLLTVGNSWVHFKTLEPGADGGCKGPNGDMVVLGMQDDPDVCGAFHCQNDSGDVLIHYCQIPAAFADCADTGVSSARPWPECCWTCVELIDCAKEETQVKPDGPIT
ncbi:uncharacterized protein [Drosophila pseudoobscura]|uniref:Single domain-containing protein n=1 Tax=Drosophila pseudoobscura pseudoobscura TaxID=46245 RepID=A0A6I8V7B5_DROPS|nr:uncharacterized protein LOC26534043 [Drosophila pseudoobscura]